LILCFTLLGVGERNRPAPQAQEKAAAQYVDWSSGFLLRLRRWQEGASSPGREVIVSHVIGRQRLVPGEQVVAADLK
jgi:hypothetical protein